MLVVTTTAIALRCPGCGRIKCHSLSLFSFSANKAIQFACDCGRTVLSVTTKDKRLYTFQVECLMCEGKHSYQFFLKDVWSQRLLSLFCSETGFEVGFIGPRHEVRRCIAEQERSLREMAEDLGFSDYFENPEVMYEVLDRLHRIAESGGLLCRCGNHHIEVELFAERVELRCPECGACGVIDAGSREDVDALRSIWEIVLQPGKLQFLGAGRAKSHHRRSKK